MVLASREGQPVLPYALASTLLRAVSVFVDDLAVRKLAAVQAAQLLLAASRCVGVAARVHAPPPVGQALFQAPAGALSLPQLATAGRTVLARLGTGEQSVCGSRD